MDRLPVWYKIRFCHASILSSPLHETYSQTLSLSIHLSISFAGLLKAGVPQKWESSKKNLKYVRKAGVRQFLSQYEKVKDLQGDELLWGDEIEYGIFKVDNENKEIRLSLRAKEVS